MVTVPVVKVRTVSSQGRLCPTSDSVSTLGGSARAGPAPEPTIAVANSTEPSTDNALRVIVSSFQPVRGGQYRDGWAPAIGQMTDIVKSYRHKTDILFGSRIATPSSAVHGCAAGRRDPAAAFAFSYVVA